MNVAWSLQVDYLECRGPLNKEHSGVCVVQSDKCCEGKFTFSTRLCIILKGCETKPPILEWGKTADFENGTKPPILEWDKTADFENGTKPPILKWKKIADL